MERPSPLEDARRFLQARRLAVVGVSRDPKHFSRYVLRALLARGIDAVAVNPGLEEVEGRRAFARVGEVAPAVEAAILMTPAAASVEVVRACGEAGVRAVWLHRGGGPGAESPEAVALARALGLELVTGLCPMMALPGAGWFHRLHGAIRARGSAREGGGRAELR